MRVHGMIIFGLDGHGVEVDVSRQDGLPGWDVAGLSPAQVREFRVRVRSALKAGGYDWPHERLAVNFAPADLPKHGTALDLPLAVAVLAFTGVIPATALTGSVFYGELGLDGQLRPVAGAVNAALAARQAGHHTIFVAPENGYEASCASGVRVLTPRTVVEMVEYLCGRHEMVPTETPAPNTHPASGYSDLANIKGQAQARRALEVAAAGRHNVLFIGPPGCGKTMLARALPGILPPLTPEEALEVTRIHSVAGLTGRRPGLVTTPPFRAPHLTTSEAALVGGGNPPMPGEVSLAHRGVLFLDEAAEFRQASLDALWAPIDDGVVVVSQSRRSVKFPSSVMMVLAMNPCPCGYLGDSRRACRCTPAMVNAYRSRLNGPLMNAVDICVELSPVQAKVDHDLSESSCVVQARVIEARKFLSEIQDTVTAEVHGTARVARTIAALEGSKQVEPRHLAEADSYRVQR